MKGTLRGAPLLGTPKDMLSKARKWASVSTGALLLGNMEGCFFLRAFLLRGIFMRFSRDTQNVSLYRGALPGNLDRVHLLRLLAKKEKVYLGSLLGPRGH